MHVLVTGGGGFLGGYIVKALLARGDRVRSFGRGNYPLMSAQGVEVVCGDIRDSAELAIACADIECVFHTAAIAGIALGPALMPALTMGALSIIVVPGITTTMAVAPILGMLAARDYMQNDRVIARLPNGRRILTVRAKHLGAIELRVQGHDGPASLTLPHDSGWSEVTGTAAIHATGVLIAGSNRFGAAPSRVQDAVQQIEDAGDASGFLTEASTRNGWRGGKVFSLLNHYRGLGAMNLSPTERLALEMSVHEETERRAMEGELAVLEAAWRDAEIIAAISDDELTPPKLYE